MKRFILALLAGLAALGRTTLIAVLESGKWVWRVVRAVANCPEPDVAQALAEADAVEPPAPAPVPLSEEERLGRRVIRALAPFGDEQPEPLEPHEAAYVARLTPAQKCDLVGVAPAEIGGFFLQKRVPPFGLPRVPTAAEHSWAIENAIRARQDAIDTAEANRLFTLAVIEDLIADCDRPRKAA